MDALAQDTLPEAERIQIELLRQAPAWRKLAMVAQLTETVRRLALHGLASRHPGASAAELHRRLADLWLGPQPAAQVYGDWSEEECE